MPIDVQDTIPALDNTVRVLILDIVPNQDNNKILPQAPPIEQTQQHKEVSLRRSTRQRRNAISNDYFVFLQGHEDGIGLIEDDQINFCQAMRSSNSQKWIDIMNDEMKSMKDNDIWDLIELLKGVKL